MLAEPVQARDERKVDEVEIQVQSLREDFQRYVRTCEVGKFTELVLEARSNAEAAEAAARAMEATYKEAHEKAQENAEVATTGSERAMDDTILEVGELTKLVTEMRERAEAAESEHVRVKEETAREVDKLTE